VSKKLTTRKFFFVLYLAFMVFCVYTLYRQWFVWPGEMECREVCESCGAELS
jgi:hypothetical protein